MIELKPGERLDELQRGELRIIQNPSKYCFGMDAVLLSGFVTVKRGESVMDLCSGSGIIPLLLSAKTEAASITGIEIQPEMAEMAQRSVRMNHLEPRVQIICGDLRDGESAGESGRQDVVTCNPPYVPRGEGIRSSENSRALSRHEISCTLEDVARAAARLLRNGGRAAFVYRPARLAELFAALNKYGMRPKRLKMVHPFRDKEANMALVEAVKGGGSSLRVEPPLIVFEEQGRYSSEVQALYGCERG